MISRWRRRIGALVGGFEAGEASRRLRHFQPSRAHLNTLIAAAGADITARARWLVRNNGYAANAIESWAGNVVGAGIKPSSLIEDPDLKADATGLVVARGPVILSKDRLVYDASVDQAAEIAAKEAELAAAGLVPRDTA